MTMRGLRQNFPGENSRLATIREEVKKKDRRSLRSEFPSEADHLLIALHDKKAFYLRDLKDKIDGYTVLNVFSEFSREEGAELMKGFLAHNKHDLVIALLEQNENLGTETLMDVISKYRRTGFTDDLHAAIVDHPAATDLPDAVNSLLERRPAEDKPWVLLALRS